MDASNKTKRIDGATDPTLTRPPTCAETKPAATPKKSLSEFIVIALLLAICCFAFGFNLLR